MLGLVEGNVVCIVTYLVLVRFILYNYLFFLGYECLENRERVL